MVEKFLQESNQNPKGDEKMVKKQSDFLDVLESQSDEVKKTESGSLSLRDRFGPNATIPDDDEGDAFDQLHGNGRRREDDKAKNRMK